MFSYYGGKSNVVKNYPKPVFDTIIEPFAGSARYALEYWERDVVLIDAYDKVVDVWHYLQQCSPGDIMNLPDFKQGDDLNKMTFDCQAQRDLAGFMIGFASVRPRSKATMWLTHRPNAVSFTKKRIADNLHKIRHWKIICGDYRSIENKTATWFVDPPYQVGGHLYVHGNRSFDYEFLRGWCFDRRGQVIVCENDNASWADFKPLCQQKGVKGVSKEVVLLIDNY